MRWDGNVLVLLIRYDSPNRHIQTALNSLKVVNVFVFPTFEKYLSFEEKHRFLIS